MITLYTYATPNGHKASILLEELGLKYTVRTLDLAAGEQHRPEFLRINPLGKMPALVEELPGGTPRRLFGSGAIMLYYAERAGRLWPTDAATKAEAMSWLMLSISDLGPTAGNLFRFTVRAPEKITYAIELFGRELDRCHAALDRRLGEAEYLAGPDYTIADIASFPFVAAAVAAGRELFGRYPNLGRWHDRIAERPAVQRGMAVPH
jgi:GST-like protein